MNQKTKKLSKLKEKREQHEQTGDVWDHAEPCHTHFGRELEEKRLKQQIFEKIKSEDIQQLLKEINPQTQECSNSKENKYKENHTWKHKN